MASTPPSLHINRATAALHSGGVIAYPTEAVWGLGCDPADELAVQRLLDLKIRPRHKGLILIAGCESQLEFLLSGLSKAQRATMQLSWPGPTTWLVPHRDRVPSWIHGEHDTVAVRVSDHPVVRALCDCWGGALVSTSANRSGGQAAREQFQVRRYFGDELDYILPGRLGGSDRPSVIRDLQSDRIIRA